MSRPVAVAIFALAVVPLLWLLVLQLVALLLMIGVLSDPLDCIADAPESTLAVVWLAFGPLTAAVATAFAGLRAGGPPAGSRRAAAIGVGVLAAGLPIALLAGEKATCPGVDSFGDDVPVPLSGFGPTAILLVALTLGAICLATLFADDRAAT